MSPTSGCVKRVADPVDQHALADLQGRDHRLARNPVRLDQEGLDAQGQAEGDRDDQDQLEQRARRSSADPFLVATPRYSLARFLVAVGRRLSGLGRLRLSDLGVS